jgi:hypothetical protein
LNSIFYAASAFRFRLQPSLLMHRHPFARHALSFGGSVLGLAQIPLCRVRHTKTHPRSLARRIPSVSRQASHRPKADTDIYAPSHRRKALVPMKLQGLASARAAVQVSTS